MALVFFWILAAISIGSALLMVANRNPVRSALFLVVNFFVLAIFYLTLSAQFIAAVQIIVYAGAIMVLFLFVIMLLNLGAPEALRERGRLQAPLALLLGLIFLSVLGAAGAISTGLAPSRATPATIDGAPLLSIGDLRDPAGLIAGLQNGQTPLSQPLRERLSEETRQEMEAFAASGSSAPSETLQAALVEDLNRIISGPSLNLALSLPQERLTPEARRLLAKQNRTDDERLRLNRLLLEQAFPEEIAKSRPIGAVETVGLALFDGAQPWLFPFEVTSVLLLVGIVGAIVMAKRKI